jgi:hypothetical protein
MTIILNPHFAIDKDANIVLYNDDDGDKLVAI